MIDALQIAATGMQAQQANVDTIANNLANVNTPGFKKARVAFVDLVTRAGGAPVPAGLALPPAGGSGRDGAGVHVAAIGRLFDAGDLRRTDSTLDIAIAGDGFLEVAMSDGSRAYVRGGTLKITSDGTLTAGTGQVLQPAITVPDGSLALTIATDGKITAATAGRSTPSELGQLTLVRFTSPSALTPLGEGLYRATEAAGEPIAGRAGEDAMGTLRQGFLEGSNVRLVDEMVSLMVAQRSYEASVKVVQAADEMLGLINGLRR